MAEPVSPLPASTPPSPTVRTEPVPWPKTVDPLPGSPEISGSNTETAVYETDTVESDWQERVRSGFKRSYSQVQGAMAEALERSRRRFRYVSQERPMQIVIGVAIASLIAGAALRVWRSNHD